MKTAEQFDKDADEIVARLKVNFKSCMETFVRDVTEIGEAMEAAGISDTFKGAIAAKLLRESEAAMEGIEL